MIGTILFLSFGIMLLAGVPIAVGLGLAGTLAGIAEITKSATAEAAASAAVRRTGFIPNAGKAE